MREKVMKKDYVKAFKITVILAVLLVQTAFILFRWPGWIAAQVMGLAVLLLLGFPAILSTAQAVLHRKQVSR